MDQHLCHHHMQPPQHIATRGADVGMRVRPHESGGMHKSRHRWNLMGEALSYAFERGRIEEITLNWRKHLSCRSLRCPINADHPPTIREQMLCHRVTNARRRPSDNSTPRCR
jgi:hypothetical protein